MNVLHIISGYHKQQLYKELINHLYQNGVLSTVYSHCEPGEIVTNEPENDSNNVHIYNHFTQLDRLTYFGKQSKIIKDLNRDYNINNIDVIHAHTLFSCGFAAFWLSKKHHIPYVVAVRSVDVNIFLKKLFFLRPIGKLILSNASSIIFLNKLIKEYTLGRYYKLDDKSKIYKKSFVIPNGIDGFFLDNRWTRDKSPNRGSIHLIMVAGINANKNIEAVIDACNILIARGEKIKFTIVGDIREDKYKSIIGNCDFISYHDKCPHEKLIDYLRNADIFVMPSHTESFGLVYAEAMSQGLPIIYTRGQGFDGQFKDGVVGYSVSDYDPYEIADKIELIIRNYLAISHNCVECVTKFDWNMISAQYVDLYKSICVR